MHYRSEQTLAFVLENDEIRPFRMWLKDRICNLVRVGTRRTRIVTGAAQWLNSCMI